MKNRSTLPRGSCRATLAKTVRMISRMNRRIVRLETRLCKLAVGLGVEVKRPKGKR